MAEDGGSDALLHESRSRLSRKSAATLRLSRGSGTPGAGKSTTPWAAQARRPAWPKARRTSVSKNSRRPRWWLLLLKEKRIRDIGLVVAIVCLLTILSMLTFKGGVVLNSYGLLLRLRGFQDATNSLAGLQHNASFYGIIKIGLLSVLHFAGITNGRSAWTYEISSIIAVPYFCLAIGLFCAASFFIVSKIDCLWQNTLILVICLVGLPTVSYDYRLIYFLIPLTLFLRDMNISEDGYHDGFSVWRLAHPEGLFHY